ncbi:MAG: hypothetical protein Q4P17_04005 [Methanobacterium sp.]|nr:hypothetical protein [Methanobacterium sp.]
MMLKDRSIEELLNSADEMQPSNVLFSPRGDEIFHKTNALLWVMGCGDMI